jgi:periplasmic copper chaperone A
VVTVIAFACLAGFAIPASAHLEGSPSQIAPGTSATITFTVAHGCAGSPTTKVTMKLPITLKDVKVQPPKGWTGSVAGSVATFTGPPIPAKSVTGFKVSFTAPKTLGVLTFPSIQQCSKGENDWIELPLANGKEPEHPAPKVLVSAAPAKSVSTSKHH